MVDEEVDIGLEERLRARVSKGRRKRSIPNESWELAKASPAYGAAAEGDEAAIDTLGKTVGHFLKDRRRGKKRLQAADDRADRAQHLLPAHERKRQEVTARHFARLARRLGEYKRQAPDGTIIHKKPDVMEFRDRYLGGKAVSPARARGILSSPAAAFLPHISFYEGQIPLAAHKSKITKSYPMVRPDKEIIQKRVLRIEWGLKKRRRTHKTTLRQPVEQSYDQLWVPDNEGPTQLSVIRGSVFDRLRELSDRLSRRYGWHPAEATWLILTDAVPSTPAFIASHRYVRSDDHFHGEIQLTVQSWVAPKTVEAAYRHLQQLHLRKVQVADDQQIQVHPTKVKSLEFFDFVSEQRSNGLSWRECMRAWNKTRPKKDRYPEKPEQWVQSFQRDYQLIEKRIAWLSWPRSSQRPRGGKRK
jgi:hypothetical protein